MIGKFKESRERFTPEEDEQLINLVKQYGTKKWTKIARDMKRSSESVRIRFFNYLAPTAKKDPWSPEEDKLIIEKHEELGNRWSIITKFLKGRTENNVRSRWSVLEKRKQREQLVQQPNMQIQDAKDVFESLDFFIGNRFIPNEDLNKITGINIKLVE